jgi:predicted CopG family antitoxin
MRKKRFTKNVGILMSNETYGQLVEVTDKEEMTVSEFIRGLVEKELMENKKGETRK